MTVHRSWLHRAAVVLAFGAIAGRGEDGVSIGRNQCPQLPMYDARDLKLERGHVVPSPDADDPAAVQKAIDKLDDAAKKLCITSLGGAVTDPAPRGTGGKPSTPEPEAGTQTPDSGSADAS